MSRAPAVTSPANGTAPVPIDVWNALPIPALLIDPDARVALANVAAETFLNASQESLAERGWAPLFPPDSPLPAIVADARRRGQGVQAFDIPLEFVGGRAVRSDVFVAHVPSSPGWMLLGFQPRSVTALVDRQLGSWGAARTVSGAAAMLAHEVRNPLSGIRGAAQLLRDMVSAEGRELADLVVREVDRIGALIDAMEAFTDERPRRREPENIHAILSHVRQVAEAGFGRRVRFVERYDPSLPPVLGDRDQLVQAVLNLVKNAVEASPEGGTITLATAYRAGIRVRPLGGSGQVSLPLEVTVIDEGEGVPPDIADHVFEPFVTSKRGGTGLGLALVAKIARDHGGLVEHERRDGRTAFRLRLPAAVGALAAE
ncbi:MAG: ATP-binding protein [Sphingomonadaceae bacterium]|uniref:two-component system sensor histidine kinase NtrB n=1 Tax=Thermaurantiacus sp. TaxID=2820283 RepID=UPI00298EE66D|nr:ATP-binding protein [Thermaurantiacus sp.]MCS6985840.1 ATP-binding protein [Sphingomonadaceae bacterium]MDW8413891.1 ATP-binding protein [Thermaurantiacus sp.]